MRASLRHSRPRGAILLLVLVLTAVLSALGGGMMLYASRSVGQAVAHRRESELAACAEAGRQLLLSKFKLFMPAAQLMELTTSMDLSKAGKDNACGTDTERCVRSGHIGASAAVTGVRAMPASSVPNAMASRDLTNIVADAFSLSGGRPYQVVVQCEGQGGRAVEVEFGLTFGL